MKYTTEKGNRCKYETEHGDIIEPNGFDGNGVFIAMWNGIEHGYRGIYLTENDLEECLRLSKEKSW